MKLRGKFVIIAKDGWPLEQIIGRPVTNFFRRLLLSSHKECEECYLRRRQIALQREQENWVGELRQCAALPGKEPK